MCQNRISILQEEKKKLEDKRRSTTKDIDRKTELRNLAAADLSWKHKEIVLVGTTIKEFRTELNHREFGRHSRDPRFHTRGLLLAPSCTLL